MRNSRIILLISLFLVISPVEGYCQVGRVVREGVEAIGKRFAKKGAKESGEQALKNGTKKLSKEASEAAAKQATKEMAEDLTAKAVSKNAGKSVAKQGATNGIKRQAGEVSRDGIGKALRNNVRKASTKTVAKGVKAGVSSAGGRAVTETVESRALREIGSKESKEAFEGITKKSLKEKGKSLSTKRAAIQAGKTFTGRQALSLLDDNPMLKREIANMEKRLGPLFSTDNLIVQKSGKSTIVSFKGTNTKIHMKGNEIIAEGGSTMTNGAMNEFLNNPLPSTTYHVDGCSKFVTDNAGRTIVSECHSSELAKKVSRNALPSQNKTPLVQNKGGKQGVHDSGHIQQHSTGGQNESINLLPMKASLQRGGAWAKLEKMERDAIARGCDVWSKKKITYHPDGSFEIAVDLMIDGKTTHKVFKNLF